MDKCTKYLKLHTKKYIVKDMKNEEKMNIAVVFLIVVAVMLGYMIFQQSRPKSTDRIEKAGAAQALFQDLADKERAVLNVPSQDSTQEEKQQHFELVLRIAKEADYLDISQCIPSPVVFKVKNDERFTVKNPDAVEHTIGLDPDHIFSVPAQSTKTIVADFGHGAGLYGYGCDASTKAVGLFLVAQ